MHNKPRGRAMGDNRDAAGLVDRAGRQRVPQGLKPQPCEHLNSLTVACLPLPFFLQKNSTLLGGRDGSRCADGAVGSTVIGSDRIPGEARAFSPRIRPLFLLYGADDIRTSEKSAGHG